MTDFPFFSSYYRPQRSSAKVMFLQAPVILLTGGGSASVHAGMPPTPDQTRPPPRPATPPPRTRHTTPPASHPQTRHTPGSRLQHTVNERTVRILLECILVKHGINLAFPKWYISLPLPAPLHFNTIV